MEITPDGLAGVIGPSIDGGVQGLEAHLEKQLIGVVAPEPVVLDVHETLADLEPLRQRFTGSGAPVHLLDNLVCRHAARRFRARGRAGGPERAAGTCARLRRAAGAGQCRSRVAVLTSRGADERTAAAVRGAARARRSGFVERRMQAAPERLPLRGRLLRCAAAAVRDGRHASVGPARRRGGRHDDRPDQPPRNAVAAGLHPADGDRPDPRPARARSGRPIRVHAWSGTGDRDHGVRPGLAMSPGADASKRARLDGRLAGTSSCAR